MPNYQTTTFPTDGGYGWPVRDSDGIRVASGISDTRENAKAEGERICRAQAAS